MSAVLRKVITRWRSGACVSVCFLGIRTAAQAAGASGVVMCASYGCWNWCYRNQCSSTNVSF